MPHYPQTSPFFLPDQTKSAYQFRWPLALFGREPLPLDALHSGELAQRLELDSIRILNWMTTAENVVLLFLSTRPPVAPVTIAQRVKGRWQHAIDGGRGKMFRRNFSLESAGDPSRLSIEGYLERQLDRHAIFEPPKRRIFERFPLQDFETNLASWRYVNHGRYRLNVHLTLVHELRRQLLDERSLRSLLAALMTALRSCECEASRVAIVPDHEHVPVRLKETCSPEKLALAVMNEVARRLGRPLHGSGRAVRRARIPRHEVRGRNRKGRCHFQSK